MSEVYVPPGATNAGVTRLTAGEATGTGGDLVGRANPTILAQRTRFMNDAGTIDQESVVAATLVNSYTAVTSGGVNYRKGRDGVVRVRIDVQNGTAVTVCTLPSGYRPAFNQFFVGTYFPSGNRAPMYILVTTGGAIEVYTMNGSSGPPPAIGTTPISAVLSFDTGL